MSDMCKGWFAVAVECDRHLSADDIEDALYGRFESRPGFKASVIKVREETHGRLLDASDTGRGKPMTVWPSDHTFVNLDPETDG